MSSEQPNTAIDPVIEVAVVVTPDAATMWIPADEDVAENVRRYIAAWKTAQSAERYNGCTSGCVHIRMLTSAYKSLPANTSGAGLAYAAGGRP